MCGSMYRCGMGPQSLLFLQKQTIQKPTDIKMTVEQKLKTEELVMSFSNTAGICSGVVIAWFAEIFGVQSYKLGILTWGDFDKLHKVEEEYDSYFKKDSYLLVPLMEMKKFLKGSVPKEGFYVKAAIYHKDILKKMTGQSENGYMEGIEGVYQDLGLLADDGCLDCYSTGELTSLLKGDLLFLNETEALHVSLRKQTESSGGHAIGIYRMGETHYLLDPNIGLMKFSSKKRLLEVLENENNDNQQYQKYTYSKYKSARVLCVSRPIGIKAKTLFELEKTKENFFRKDKFKFS